MIYLLIYFGSLFLTWCSIHVDFDNRFLNFFKSAITVFCIGVCFVDSLFIINWIFKFMP